MGRRPSSTRGDQLIPKRNTSTGGQQEVFPVEILIVYPHTTLPTELQPCASARRATTPCQDCAERVAAERGPRGQPASRMR
jgi:hypothetical protein